MKKNLFILLLLCPVLLVAQKGHTAIGFSLKPIVPSKLFRNAEVNYEVDNIAVNISPNPGIIWGITLRSGLSKSFSIESGIFINNRTLTLDAKTIEGEYDEWVSKYNVHNYEIPLSLVVFVPIQNKLYANASGGFVAGFYPSSLYTFDNTGDANARFSQLTYRKNWVNFALNSNAGLEYRSKIGYIYVGLSYHLPFSKPFITVVQRSNSAKSGYKPFAEYATELNANYFTIDFRFFLVDSKKEESNTSKK